MAYCTFIKPTTFSARAKRRVYSRIVSRTAGVRLTGGSTQEESPECTPASSMCSMMPPMITSAASWSTLKKRSEEHTSELQSHSDLVCRLLLEKKNQHDINDGVDLAGHHNCSQVGDA